MRPCRSRAAHTAAATGFVFLGLILLAADWKIAEPGWGLRISTRSSCASRIQTEWWYFTGNLSIPRAVVSAMN